MRAHVLKLYENCPLRNGKKNVFSRVKYFRELVTLTSPHTNIFQTVPCENDPRKLQSASPHIFVIFSKRSDTKRVTIFLIFFKSYTSEIQYYYSVVIFIIIANSQSRIKRERERILSSVRFLYMICCTHISIINSCRTRTILFAYFHKSENYNVEAVTCFARHKITLKIR